MRSLTHRARLFLRQGTGKQLPLFLAGSSLFLYLHLFRLPWTPMFTEGGQDVYLLGGMRMLDGQVVYRDFFDFVAPGTNVVYFLLFKIFGIRAWIPNVMLILLGLGLVWLSVVVARRVMHGILVFLPGLVFLTFSFRYRPDANHHWYSALAVLAALALVVETRSVTRLAAAGGLCGVACFFTQTRGVAALLGLGVFLLWQARTQGLSGHWLRRSAVALFTGFLASTLALYAYFIVQAGWARVVDCTVVFLFRHAAAADFNNWSAFWADQPDHRSWTGLGMLGVWLFTHFFPLVVYPMYLWRHRRESARPLLGPWESRMMLCIVGLALLLGIARAPNTQRLAADSFPALILLAGMLDSTNLVPRLVRRGLWLASLSCVLITPLFKQYRYAPQYLDVPAGRIAIFDPSIAEELRWLALRTRPGEYFFGGAFLNFYLHLRDPVEVPFLTATDFTRPEQVEGAIKALETHQVRLVLWLTDLDRPDPTSPQGYHLGPLVAYLRQHYQVIKTFSGGYTEILERRP